MFQRQLTFEEAARKCLQQNYCNFSGRASRSEYWWFYLLTVVLGLVAGFIGGLLGETVHSILTGIVSLGLFLPSLGVMVRRLHDTGRSGWWWLIALTGIGALLLLYWLVQPSQPVPNKYGEVPNMAA
ncbi:MAG: DUF805 domain-containing protein [Duncaniella sp.]|nr:DUF805 domain-containing protein [Duncaniella sp.]MDE5734373.1 DUF805 domain-containing protein [Duncaniella sp.]MDE6178980.1 DUF805 domain-containing protein [Duncaniella sp.]